MSVWSMNVGKQICTLSNLHKSQILKFLLINAALSMWIPQTACHMKMKDENYKEDWNWVLFNGKNILFIEAAILLTNISSAISLYMS